MKKGPWIKIKTIAQLIADDAYLCYWRDLHANSHHRYLMEHYERLQHLIGQIRDEDEAK